MPNYIYGTQGDDTLIGTSGDDYIQALGGTDSVAGGAGNDALDGGIDFNYNLLVGQTGNDTYVVKAFAGLAGDIIVENANEGLDRILSFSDWDMQNYDFDGDSAGDAINVEYIRLVSGYSISFSGTTMVLTSVATNAWGNALDNTMEGTDAINTLAGRAGDDTYIVHDLPGTTFADVIIEVAGEGNDTIIYNPYVLPVTKTYVLSDSSDPNSQVENLTLGGSFALNATGNALDNTLTGNSATNTLIGLTGDDTYIIQSASDIVKENAAEGDDTIQCGFTLSLAAVAYANFENITLTGTGNFNATGNAADNFLRGNTGNNTLDGGLDSGVGIDTYFGDSGNDVYIINNVADYIRPTYTTPDGTIHTDGGTDLIKATLTAGQTYDMSVLATTVENLTLLGTAAVNAIGNAGDNVITGNAANNIIYGDDVTVTNSTGADTLLGGLGNDTLYSSGGSTKLDGGAGADTMYSSSGDDTFFVDNLGDRVYSGVSPGGFDAINSSVSFDMNVQSAGSGQRALNLTGTLAINAVGNDLSDTINGNVSNNSLTGGAGDDTIAGNGGVDKFFGLGGNDTLTGGGGKDAMDGGTGDDTLIGAGSADTLVGGTGNDILDGGAGDVDTLIGGTGDDVFEMRDKLDTIIESFNGGTDTVEAFQSFTLASFDTITHVGSEVENLMLTSGTIGIGNALNNYIAGNGSNNTLNGLSGADTMEGKTGDDTYFADNTGDKVIEAFDEGTDIVFFSHTVAGTTYTLDANVENLTLQGTAAINGTGNALGNIIIGNSATNTLTGLAGDDTYIMDNTLDFVIEAGSAGTDTIMSSVTLDLSAAPYAGNEIENLTLTGSGDINGKGNDLDNVITGNIGKNTLDGGLGNDTYVLGNQNDPLHPDIIVADAGGNDTVSVAASYSIASRLDLDNITLTGTGNFNATGNSGVNILTGNGGNNLLDAGAGADTYVGSAGNDVYLVDDPADVVTGLDSGTDTVLASVTYDMLANALVVDNLTLSGTAAIDGAGNNLDNVITGNSALNTLAGNGGNDTFHSGGGGDTLLGGTGGDTYFVDFANDIIVENVGEGTDVVTASVSYDMSTNATGEVEKLTLAGSAIYGIGNASDNVITGNAGNNTLTGLGGNDTLNGGGGNDTLDGGIGNDTLDGGGGVDTMTGGTGDDTFIVDSSADVIVENPTEGAVDLIKTAIINDTTSNAFDLRKITDIATHTVVQEIENLTLTGSSNINAIGNDFDNTLTGNSGNNTLDGGLGVDTMIGNGGNDTYMVDNSGDVVIGDGKVFASTSYNMGVNATAAVFLTLTGSASDIGTGNTTNNTITGTGAVDYTFDGGTGNDTILLHRIGDKVVDAADAGHDLIIISSTSDPLGLSFSYDMSVMAQNVDSLTITGTHDFDVTDNNQDNTLTGNNAINHFFGSGGNDTYFIEARDFVVDTGGGPAEKDIIAVGFTASLAADALLATPRWQGIEGITLTGTAALNATGDTNANVLTGNSAINILNDGGVLVGLGADTMIGGAGNDTYFVNNATDVIDEVTLGGAGVDLVISTVNYALSAGVDNLTLTGSAIAGTGNSLANIIIGTAGNNTLDGGTGLDTLNGGLGNDTYFVDASDTIIDSGGVDTVVSQMSSYTLVSGMENLKLAEISSVITGTGNAVVNVITGNSFDNVLDGKAGADMMIGGDGNDTYVVDSFLDVATEVIDGSTIAGAGAHDLIMTALNNYVLSNTSEVEDLTLLGSALVGTGNGLNNTITGNAAANTLFGGDGNDVLDGGLGKDTYWGGLGQDTFVVGSDATTNPDTIKDFGVGGIADVIDFRLNIDPLVNVLEDFIAARYDSTALGGLGATYFYIDRDGITVNGAHFVLALTVEGVDVTGILG